MRILVHDYTGHPFQVQLSRSLARRGYQILHVYSASFITPRGKLEKLNSDPRTFDCQPLFLSKPFQKLSFIKRRFQEIEYGKLVAQTVDRFNPEVVISANAPLDAQKILLKKCKGNKIKFIFWVQDLISTAIKKILSRKFFLFGSLIGIYYSRLEFAMLQQSDQVVAITDDHAKIFVEAGILPEKIHVVPNWAPLEELPLFPKKNDWARQFGFHDKLCILYSGTLGLKHNPELLLNLAVKFKNRDDVSIIVITEGRGADFLKEKKQQFDLKNLFLFDFQPFELMPQILATADILVAILEEAAGIFSVPSKVLTYHCAGRAVLLSAPARNLAARIVKDNQTGLVVSPQDEAGFLKAAETLLDDVYLRQVLSKNARKYAQDTFQIEKITDQFEKILLA